MSGTEQVFNLDDSIALIKDGLRSMQDRRKLVADKQVELDREANQLDREIARTETLLGLHKKTSASDRAVAKQVPTQGKPRERVYRLVVDSFRHLHLSSGPTHQTESEPDIRYETILQLVSEAAPTVNEGSVRSAVNRMVDRGILKRVGTRSNRLYRITDHIKLFAQWGKEPNTGQQLPLQTIPPEPDVRASAETVLPPEPDKKPVRQVIIDLLTAAGPNGLAASALRWSVEDEAEVQAAVAAGAIVESGDHFRLPTPEEQAGRPLFPAQQLNV